MMGVVIPCIVLILFLLFLLVSRGTAFFVCLFYVACAFFRRVLF